MGLRERMRTWTRDDINRKPAKPPSLTHDEVVEIGRQVVLGLKAPSREGRERRAVRARIARQVAAIRKDGGIVELPVEDGEVSPS